MPLLKLNAVRLPFELTTLANLFSMARQDSFFLDLPTSVEDVEPLTFERDIAPLKQQYFQQVMADPRMSFGAKMRASQMVSGAVDAGYTEARKVAEADREARQQAGLRDLQFKQTLFNLQKARDDAEQERRSVETFAPLAQQLSAITADPNKPVEDASRELSQFGINYAPVLATNKPLDIAYRSAMQSLSGRQKPQTFTLGSVINSGVSIADLKEAHLQAGLPFNSSDINTNLNPEVFSNIMQIQKKRQAEQEFQTKQLAKQEAAAEKEQSRVMDDLRNVKFTEFNASAESGMQPEEFVPEMTPQSSVIVSRIINQYGTEEDKKAYAKLVEENKAILKQNRDSLAAKRADSTGKMPAPMLSTKKGDNDMALFSLARDIADRTFASRAAGQDQPSKSEQKIQDVASSFSK
jgi:hypothetical protein